MSKIIKITVAEKVATYRLRDGAVVCGNSDYAVQFTFDSDWSRHETKTARFIYNGVTEDVVFQGDTVPVPVIKNATILKVGVYAGDLVTTTPAVVPCLKSILCEGGLPADPSPDVYTQIMHLLNLGRAARIDLSRFGSEGVIVETLGDGSTRTTTMQFDANGNPVKVTDSDGHETVLTW